MLEKELSFADLPISLSELYEAMGYADAVPDEAVEKEVRGVLERVEAVTSPRFCFFISGGELDESKDSLSVGDTYFSIGKIITRQLRGSESFAVSIRPRACFFPLFSFLPLWLHYNLNPLCVQY